MNKDTKVNDKKSKELTMSSKNKTKLFFENFKKNISSIRYILLWYFLISIFGTFLLWLPISQKSGANISFLDALFMSSSSFSDTGLSTLSVADTFNYFGKFIILILLNVGGVGLFTIKIFILKYILNRKVSFSEISDGSAEVGTNNKNETLGLVFSSIIISLFSTFFFGLIFGIMFATIHNNPILSNNAVPDPDLYGNWGNSILTGIFHASASVNNSGLDVFKGDVSMAPYSGNIGIQVLTIFLFIIGGIGFGVFYDVYKYLLSKKTGTAFSFSLVTKISVVTYAIISLLGLSLVYLSEGLATINNSDAFLNGDNQGYKSWALAFNTFSTRNAGFSTMDLGKAGGLNPLKTMIQALMMFIGSGPGSTAGGLRTTTFAIIVIATWSSIRGHKRTHIFNRSIPSETIRSSLMIFISSIILTFVTIMFISLFEIIGGNDQFDILDIVFVTLSAYGTTGLSTVAISTSTVASKLMIIVIMFIGQLGMSTTLSQLKTRKVIISDKTFIEESVSLG